MSRPSTVALNTRLAVRTGHEPLIAIAINWGLVPVWFASRAMTLPNTAVATGRIISLGNCQCEQRQDNTATTGSMSVTLDDKDLVLKTIIDNDIGEQALATVYLYYADLAGVDMVPLLNGKVAGPLAWDEGKRQLSFTIEVFIEEGEAGFVPTDEFEDLSDQAKNRPWPMIFGKVAHVPAVKVREHREGILKGGINLDGDLVEFDPTTKEAKFKAFNTVTGDYGDGIIQVKNGSKFPQSTELKITIDGVIFEGEFDGDEFTVSAANVPKYEDIDLADRGGNILYEMFFLEDASINLAGHHVYFQVAAGYVWYNYVVSQEGNECFCKWPIVSPVTGKPVLLTSTHTIARAYRLTEYGTSNPEYASKLYLLTARFNKVQPVNPAGNKGATVKRIIDYASKNEVFWSAAAGTIVRLWDQEDPDIYVVSIVPCTEINAVYGRRKIQLRNGRDEEFFVPIPSGYYEVELESNYEVEGDFVTGLLFYLPLTDRDEETWSDEVYVTATSSVGPNTADIIEYILQRFTTIVLNGPSFSSVATQIEAVPSNFALFEKKNALELSREIAWQARCGLRLDSTEADLVFLAEEPLYAMTFNEDNTDFGTLQYSFTPIDQITTKLVGRWTETYKNKNKFLQVDSPDFKGGKFSGFLIDEKDNDEKTTVYRNNIDLFGEREKDIDIYIYNEEQYVLKTLEFWGYRYSNCWRYITLETYLPAMILQPWDGVTLTYTNAAINNISSAPGVVEESSFSPTDWKTTLKIWVPSKAGEFTIDEDVWEEGA